MPKSQQYEEMRCFRTSYATILDLTKRAHADGVDVSEVIRRAIAAYLDDERQLTALERYRRTAQGRK